MDSVGSVLWTVFSWVLFLSTTGWVGYHWLRRSEEGPVRILAKVAASAVVFGFLLKVVGPMLGGGGGDRGLALGRRVRIGARGAVAGEPH